MRENVYAMYVWLQRSKEGFLFLWNRSYGCCESPCGCWELNLDPLEEQQVFLTTDPSLQLHVFAFEWGFAMYCGLQCVAQAGIRLWGLGLRGHSTTAGSVVCFTPLYFTTLPRVESVCITYPFLEKGLANPDIRWKLSRSCLSSVWSRIQGRAWKEVLAEWND